MISAEKLIQLDRSPRRVLLTALVVVVAFGLFKWIFAPFNMQLKAAQQYDSALDNTIRKTTSMAKTLEAKKGKLQKMIRKADQLRSQLFTPDEVRVFFANFQDFAQKAGCTIQSVNLVPEQKVSSKKERADDGTGIISKKVAVTVFGGYGNIVGFLEGLQSYERKVWLNSVRMDIVSGSGKLKCQVVLTIYCIERVETSLYE